MGQNGSRGKSPCGCRRETGWRFSIKPSDHRGPRSQRFPAAPETARTERSRWVDDLVAKFGMRSIDAAVKVSVEDNSAANPGPYRHIDESRLILSGSPTCLRHGGGIGVV